MTKLTAEEIARMRLELEQSDWPGSPLFWSRDHALSLLDHAAHTLAEEGRKDAEIAELRATINDDLLPQVSYWSARAVGLAEENSRLSAEVERLRGTVRPFKQGAFADWWNTDVRQFPTMPSEVRRDPERVFNEGWKAAMALVEAALSPSPSPAKLEEGM